MNSECDRDFHAMADLIATAIDNPTCYSLAYPLQMDKVQLNENWQLGLDNQSFL